MRRSPRERLRAVFEEAFRRFLERETKNILYGTSEQNLCACLAPVLEAEASAAGFDGYRADVEYNRNHAGTVKTIIDDKMQVVRIKCDLILHSRGEELAKDNLIAIEMKRANHRQREKEKDRTRLRAMTKASFDDVWSADGVTLPEHVCGYELGYYLELDVEARHFRIEEYQDGAQRDESYVDF